MSHADRVADPLQTALGELERRLREFGSPIVERLRPGLPRERVEAVLGRYGLAAPVELRTLWGWHDGTDTRDYRGTQLVGSWHVLSLEQAAEDHEFHRRIADELVGRPEGYPPGWFPALLFENGPFLAADCTSDPERESPLYVVDGHAGLPEEPPTPHFPSLRHLIETFVRFFDLGLVERDDVRGGATVPWERIPEELRYTGYW